MAEKTIKWNSFSHSQGLEPLEKKKKTYQKKVASTQ